MNNFTSSKSLFFRRPCAKHPGWESRQSKRCGPWPGRNRSKIGKTKLASVIDTAKRFSAYPPITYSHRPRFDTGAYRMALWSLWENAVSTCWFGKASQRLGG